MEHGLDPDPAREPVPEHVDVLIVGAGLSGIGAACHLQEECPEKSYAILESRGAVGGTWDLLRYPGVRSDSDMFTLGYAFRPWKDSTAIADGPAIRRYIEETAAEYGVTDKVCFHHRVLSAQWSSDDARWTVTAARSDTGETVRVTCSWLSLCSGYYRYDEGFRPSFPGEERFTGRLVHPQHWPEDLDADVVVTATGLNLLAMGGMSLTVDGAPVDVSERVSYKGMMLSGVPNLAMVIGYTNASWTLKADLVNRYVCRLLRHLDEHGYVSATPVAPPEGGDEPFLDLASGYVQRSLADLPKQGSRKPWKLHQNYLRDVALMRRGPLDDEGMTFQCAAAPARRAA